MAGQRVPRDTVVVDAPLERSRGVSVSRPPINATRREETDKSITLVCIQRSWVAGTACFARESNNGAPSAPGSATLRAGRP
jgi:hypothetical protein